MENQKKKLVSPMSTIIIALSVFIIAESIWLVGKLEEISNKAGSTNKPSLVVQDSVKIEPMATISLSGPTQATKGENFFVQVRIKTEKNFTSHGLDVVLNYDPRVLKALGKAKVDSQSPFKTDGLNFVEEDKERILVTLINLDGEGFGFEKGGEYSLFALEFEALKEGEVMLEIELDEEKSRKTQIIESDTDQLLPLDKKDLTVVVF